MPAKKKARGNPVVVLRLSPELLAQVDDAVTRSQEKKFDGGYDRSSFIRACIEERFEKYQRAKKANEKKRVLTEAEAEVLCAVVASTSDPVKRGEDVDTMIERLLGS